MLRHNQAQLDFIVKMFVDDHPKDWKLIRHGSVAMSEAEAAWANVVTSPAMMQEFMPSEAVLARLRQRQPVVRVHPSIAGTVASAPDTGMLNAANATTPPTGDNR